MLYEEYNSYSDAIERLLKMLLKRKKLSFNNYKSYVGMLNLEMADNEKTLDGIYRGIIKLDPHLYIKKDIDKFTITHASEEVYNDRLLILKIKRL